MLKTRALSFLTLALLSGAAVGQVRFADATDSAGLGGINGVRLRLVDVDADGRPDAIIRQRGAKGEADQYRVFLNRAVFDEDNATAFTFKELDSPSGLPVPRANDMCVFADLDSDGIADAIFARFLDINNDKYEAPTDAPPTPPTTCWLKGNGDGTFGEPVGSWLAIEGAQQATTACIAIGDVDRNGLLDVYLGNWYQKYGGGLGGFANDLLLQEWTAPGEPIAFTREPLAPAHLEFDEQLDRAGRPTYGVMCVWFDDLGPCLLDLNYGRRWNRLWGYMVGRPPSAAEGDRVWSELGNRLGIAGDAITHGRHPEWLKERAKTDPRFDRPDEKPFRSNGNTFDAAIGDIDNDGDFDLFVAEITHGWAGESSDRSRFLVNTKRGLAKERFASMPGLSVDRAPADPSIRSWNQGDLFCALADFDQDGRLDLLLSSGDYPDNQRLRLFRQQDDGTFEDITSWTGLDNDGSVQISLGDVDLDGDMDILVGQSFFRYSASKKAGRSPRIKLYLNQTQHQGNSITLKLEGATEHGVNLDALGAIVRVTATIRGKKITQSRQLIGIGGHAGKQHEFLVHVGLGDATVASKIHIQWPGLTQQVTTLEDVAAGRHVVRVGGD